MIFADLCWSQMYTCWCAFQLNLLFICRFIFHFDDSSSSSLVIQLYWGPYCMPIGLSIYIKTENGVITSKCTSEPVWQGPSVFQILVSHVIYFVIITSANSGKGYVISRVCVFVCCFCVCCFVFKITQKVVDGL